MATQAYHIAINEKLTSDQEHSLLKTLSYETRVKNPNGYLSRFLTEDTVKWFSDCMADGTSTDLLEHYRDARAWRVFASNSRDHEIEQLKSEVATLRQQVLTLKAELYDLSHRGD